MNQKEQDEFCKKHGLKKYHLLMQVEHGGCPINENGFSEDLRGELEITVFAASKMDAERVAYEAYKCTCRDVDIVEEEDCDYEDDEEVDQLVEAGENRAVAEDYVKTKQEGESER